MNAMSAHSTLLFSISEIPYRCLSYLAPLKKSDRFDTEFWFPFVMKYFFEMTLPLCDASSAQIKQALVEWFFKINYEYIMVICNK